MINLPLWFDLKKSHTTAVLYDSPFNLYTSAGYGGLAEGLSGVLPFFPTTGNELFLFLRNPRIQVSSSFSLSTLHPFIFNHQTVTLHKEIP
ncbi:hypothetical protein L1887_31887 [Cichorium endivia]|nr:hypothetical protein L1887_31887 [Cichorium endivia]